MRTLLLLLLPAIFAACPSADDPNAPAEQPDPQLASVTPESFTDPCGDPAPTLPFDLGEVVVTSHRAGLVVNPPEDTSSLAFEVSGNLQLAKGEQTKIRVKITACPHEATFCVDVQVPTLEGEAPDTAKFEIEIKPSEPPPPPPVTPRVIDVDASDVERFSGVNEGFFEDYPPGGAAPLLLVAARDAVVVTNLKTDAEIEKLTTPTGATYGAKAFTNSSGKAIVATGEWGAAVWQYVAGSFVMLGGAPFVTGNITDVVVCPDGRIIVANRTAGEIQFYNLVSGKYELQADLTIVLDGVVSIAKLPDGEYMADTEDALGNGTAWWIPADELPREIGPVAKSPRIISASPDGNFAVMPCLGDGISFPEVYFLTRVDAASDWEVAQSLLGIAAVSCGLAPLANGNYAVAIPSSRTDEVRFLEMEPDATVVAQSDQPVGTGCGEPYHTIIFGIGVYSSCRVGSKIDCQGLPD